MRNQRRGIPEAGYVSYLLRHSLWFLQKHVHHLCMRVFILRFCNYSPSKVIAFSYSSLPRRCRWRWHYLPSRVQPPAFWRWVSSFALILNPTCIQKRSIHKEPKRQWRPRVKESFSLQLLISLSKFTHAHTNLQLVIILCTYVQISNIVYIYVFIFKIYVVFFLCIYRIIVLLLLKSRTTFDKLQYYNIPVFYILHFMETAWRGLVVLWSPNFTLLLY